MRPAGVRVNTPGAPQFPPRPAHNFKCDGNGIAAKR